MCRFLAYLGKQPKLLASLMAEPENSLIKQSRGAYDDHFHLNADGFGIGWYNQSIDEEPATFKSIQPAWNDENLRHIVSKVASNCFVGHVRMSTVGAVHMSNCHPFANKEFLFTHNGTIDHFDQIRQSLIAELTPAQFASIQGHTDSEHFFALLVQQLQAISQHLTADSFMAAFSASLSRLANLLQDANQPFTTRLNTVLTNGKVAAVTRFAIGERAAPTLYYLQGVDEVIVASEPLNPADNWQEIPLNHYLFIDAAFKLHLQAVEL